MKPMDEMLEFNIIKNKLKEYALTREAKEKFDRLCPILKEWELKDKMRETTEARTLLDVQGTPPLGSTDGIKEIVEAASRGEMLTIDRLETICQYTILCSRVKKYLNKGEELFLSLASYGKGMEELDLLKEEIQQCVWNGKIDDNASKELKEVRKKMNQASANIRIKLESILKTKKQYFSDNYISNRNGHYTLPVKKEYKLMVSGSVIDTSSSGATYFIEPASVSKLKQDLMELEIRESNEERRILYTLSSFVHEYEREIIQNLDYLGALDFAFAKGKLSMEMDGREPAINTQRYVRLVNTKHPLIDKTKCVPLNVEFGDKNRGIVITGPNTGGKTVALKTVGLCSVMAQSGLHIPCEEGSIAMNSQVLCDIGDGQSITENLSTFSAHIKNVITIMERVDEESLVLMDELGSGTDPTEGMGIAISILEELKKSRCNFIATTHYPEVKEYAAKSEGLINAGMAFDRESLKPLYALVMGKAGESCALYIAKRLGMPEGMLKRAYEETLKRNGKPEKLCENDSKKKIEPEKLWTDSKEDEERPGGSGYQSGRKIEKEEPKKPVNASLGRFTVGDSVMVYPQKKIGIVFRTADEKGDVGVQIQKSKIFVNHKRLKLKAPARELYPEDYDFSIIFDSVENRKARHIMERKHVKGLEIKSDFSN